MKQVCLRLSFVAVLVTAVSVGSPQQVANGSPTEAAPKMVADGFPTPWPKKPSAVEVPTVVADGFPTPWPKKPAFVLG